MSEELLNEVAETEEIEAVNNPVDEFDDLEMPTNDTEEQEADEEQQDEESEADELVNWFNEQKLKADGKEYKYESRDEILSDARRGRTVDRIIEQRDKYRNDPGLKFMQDYMRDSGYNDMSKFIHDLQVTQKANDLVSKGMNEESAREEAERFISSRAPETNARDAEISAFLDWHESKFGEGITEVPEEVLSAYEKGQPLREAYLEFKLDNAKVETQQETLKALKKNKEKSAGDLAKGQTKQPDPSISQIDKLMSKMSQSQQAQYFDDNETMLERIGYFNR